MKKDFVSTFWQFFRIFREFSNNLVADSAKDFERLLDFHFRNGFMVLFFSAKKAKNQQILLLNFAKSDILQRCYLIYRSIYPFR